MPKSKIVSNLAFKQNHGPLDIDKLTTIIEQAYDSYNTTRDRQKKSFAPSGIGYGHGKCPRYWYLAFDGVEFVESNDARSLANMKNGIAAHDRLGELLERSSLNVTGLEVVMEHADPPIYGFIDVVIDRAGEEVIGEIKTTRTEAFRARQAKMTPPDYHLIQILIYMYIRNADSGFFMYEDKNTHELLLMPVYMTDENKEYVERVFDWMREVRKSWSDRVLPEIPYRKNARECKSCPVRDVCYDSEAYGKGDQRIEPLKLKPV
jgi:CRISPR/Cas system-associated exonuclease Cas4 (RecB family)